MKRHSVQKIHLDRKEVLENDASSQATVYRWTAALQRGHQSTEDEHRSGRPSDVCTEEMLILSRTRYQKAEDELSHSGTVVSQCCKDDNQSRYFQPLHKYWRENPTFLGASLTKCHALFFFCVGFYDRLANPTRLPILKSLPSVIAGLLKENSQIWGAPLAQGDAHFSSACDFMMALGKPKLRTKFEVANFSRCRNIKGEPQNFRELP